MAATMEILIGDSGADHLILRPLSRCLPGLFDDWDGNWIDCEIEVSAGAFQGRVRANLRSEEFEAFLSELDALNGALEGAAAFSSFEGQVSLSLVGQGSAHARIEGEVVDAAGSGSRLQFAFDIDQTCLPGIRQSLEQVLKAFPVVALVDPADKGKAALENEDGPNGRR